MIEGTLKQAASWCDGRLNGADHRFAGVSTDTRSLGKGQLFVALEGERFDAHQFLDRAALGGASGVVVHRDVSTELSQVVVDDTRLALGRLAAYWRTQLTARVVALTGSNGKTTVKEMLAAILARCGSVHATRGNLNNDIGLPLTLLAADPHDDYLVLELGANAPGDIAYLTAIGRSHVALVNNAGPAHLEGFGSVAGVARAKGEIFDGLLADGTAVFNGDDGHAAVWRALTAHRKRLEFGFAPDRDVRGELLDAADNRVRIHLPGSTFEARVPLPGPHNVMNALAASAVAFALGAAIDDIRGGLESVHGVPGRLQRVLGRHGARILNDTYNANPLSLRAGIDALASEPGQHWLVLGDMLELGAHGADHHRAAGRLARDAGCFRLFTFGALSRGAAEEFGPGAAHFEAVEPLCEALSAALEATAEPVTMLVKGSRGMRLERVVACLAEPEETA